MNSEEKAKIREAIRLLAHENDWDGGMLILLKLAGLPTKGLEAVMNAVGVPINELLAELRELDEKRKSDLKNGS